VSAALLFLACTLCAQEPPPLIADQPEYKPEDSAKMQTDLEQVGRDLQQVLLKSPRIDRFNWDDFALAQLKLEKASLLLLRYSAGEARDVAFRKEIVQLRDIMKPLSTGKRYARPASGLIEKAYFSDIDRSAQPYYVYVPENLDPKKPAPLFLFLHGYVGSVDKVNWYDMLVPDSVKAFADKIGGIALVPYARSNTDFQGIGELDVLHTIDLVKRDWRIDEDRVFLSGASMGASGVWCIGAHYPDRFAGIIPVAGRTDFNMWQKIPRGELTPFKQFIVDRDFATTLAPNFRNLPVFAFHGEKDWLIEPEQTKDMLKKLADLGFETRFHEFTGGDHWVFGQAYEDDSLVEWAKTHRRNSRPTRVSYRTYNPCYGRAYWVSIDDFVESGKPAEIDVTVKGQHLVAVKAENVARFTLDLRTTFFSTKTKVVLEDGRELEPSASKDLLLTFTLSEVPERGLRKRGDLSGPLWKAYEKPFLIVYGTGGRPEETLALKDQATRALKEWYDFAQGIPRIVRDADINDEHVRQYNLVLYGSPRTNLFIRRIANKLPVHIGDGEFEVYGEKYAGKNLGLAMIYPNPANADRYVVIYSGTFWGDALPRNHKYDFLPDYIVFDETPSPVGQTNNFRVAGFFDINWRLDPKLLWTGPEKAPEKPPEAPTPTEGEKPEEPAPAE
jgi:poly(3-hydroxybutyrate) depolymerase